MTSRSFIQRARSSPLASVIKQKKERNKKRGEEEIISSSPLFFISSVFLHLSQLRSDRAVRELA